MKTEWDYTTLADAYLKRPDYAADAIDALVTLARLAPGADVCDLGAGAGHLTLMLADRGLRVAAVEPNDAMRANGIKRTASLANVRWFEGTGEASGQPTAAFDLVTFGSSFNVTDRPAALRETARILHPRGWFACMWNHRDLADPIQATVESIIVDHVPDYGYGARREDQTAIIDASGLFGSVQTIAGNVAHRVSIADSIEAWRSHGTLARQSGARFDSVVDAIAAYLRGLDVESILVPYVTRIWVAQKQT
jgi:ubiquinone/menaquinone biosynthesis C-methylase UbiE